MVANSFPSLMSRVFGEERNSISDMILSYLMTLNMRLIQLREMQGTRMRILLPLSYILQLSLILVGCVLMALPFIMILSLIIFLSITLALSQVMMTLHGSLLHIKQLVLKVLHYGNHGSQRQS